MGMIDDGTGKGFQAKVTSKNQLSTASVSVNEATSISSVDEGAFAFNFTRTLASADTVEIIGFMQYTGNFRLQIDAIITSRIDVELDIGSSNQCSVDIKTGATFTSGGATVTPVNLKLGSNVTVTNVSHSGATTLVLGTGSAVKLMGISTNNTDTRIIQGGIIMTKNDTLHFEGQSATIGDIINMTVIAYEVKEVI